MTTPCPHTDVKLHDPMVAGAGRASMPIAFRWFCDLCGREFRPRAIAGPVKTRWLAWRLHRGVVKELRRASG